MRLVCDAEFEHHGVRIWRTLKPEVGFVVEGFLPITFWPSFLRAEQAAEIVSVEQADSEPVLA